MRNKKAKALRKDVMIRLYAGDGITASDVRKGKHDVMKDPDFKNVFRARKKNESKLILVVKAMDAHRGYDHKMKQMRDHRIKKAELAKRKRAG